MSDTLAVRIAQRGVLTLPKAIRERYGLEAGDALTILDLEGVLVLSPRDSEVDALSDRIVRRLTEQGESLESVLTLLREERERYGSAT